MEQQEINKILEAMASGNAAGDQEERFRNWFAEQDAETANAVMEQYQELLKQHPTHGTADPELLQTIERKLDKVDDNIPVRTLPRIYRYAAAAAILLVCSLAAVYFFNREDGGGHSEITSLGTTGEAISPGKEGAILILENGSTVLLDTASTGKVAGGAELNAEENRLSYTVIPKNASAVAYHTMRTPRGRTFSLELSDGSRVWLNAESSIRFPTAFTGGERNVEIEGEVYFEVASRTDQPFIVEAQGTKVEVLGTHFNINSYQDEADITTTLVEGSVKVSNASSSRILRPGTQASVQKKTGTITVNHTADIEQALAWKNGYFRMNSMDIPTLMRQIARWYDVELIYEKGIPQGHITGTVPRNMELSKVLTALQLSGVDFRIEGRKLYISS